MSLRVFKDKSRNSSSLTHQTPTDSLQKIMKHKVSLAHDIKVSRETLIY